MKKKLKKMSYKSVSAGKEDGLTTKELWWECLRRTKEYQEDYSTYRETCKKLYDGDDNALSSYEIEQERFFLEKYQLAFPLNPKMTIWFDMQPDLNSSLISNLIFHGYKREWINSASECLRAAVCLDLMRNVIPAPSGDEPDTEPFTEQELKAKTSITVVVDLNAPLFQIKNDVESIVTEWQKMRSSVIPIPKQLTKPKLLERRRQLMVYDFMKKEDSIDQAARKFHKRDYASDENYARKKATIDYKSAIKLIEGGEFRKIR